MHLELDLKLNPWIDNLQSDIDINQHLNKLLNIGYNVMNQITLTQNSEQTNKFIELYNKHNEQAMIIFAVMLFKIRQVLMNAFLKLKKNIKNS